MANIKNEKMENPEYPAEFETLFNEAFENAIDSLPSYSESERRTSWEQIQKKLERNKTRRRRRRQAQLFGIVAASMLLGAALFSPPLVTKAISPIFQELKNLGSGMSRMVFGNGQPQSDPALAKTPPPPDGFTEEELREMNKSVHLVDAGTYETVEMSMEDAKETLAFSLPRITNIPERFTLTSLQVVIPSGTPEDPNTFGKSAHLLYKSEDNKMLRLMFDLLMNNEILSTMSKENTEEIELDNGNVAYLSSGNMTEINMMIGDVYFNVIGDVNKEEIVAIANGLNQ